MKKLFTTLFTAVLTFAIMATPVLAKDVTLTFNGNVLKPSVAPIVVNGTTYIPLRIVADNLGAQTNYSKTSKNEYIEIAKNDTVIKLAVKAEKGYPQVNGQEVKLDVLPKIVNSTTMVPVRFVSENLGCTINYDAKTKTVAITANAPSENASNSGTTETPGTTETSGTPKAGVNFALLRKEQLREGVVFDIILEDTTLKSEFLNPAVLGQNIQSNISGQISVGVIEDFRIEYGIKTDAELPDVWEIVIPGHVLTCNQDLPLNISIME